MIFAVVEVVACGGVMTSLIKYVIIICNDVTRASLNKDV